jgi:hypothetical protein
MRFQLSQDMRQELRLVCPLCGGYAGMADGGGHTDRCPQGRVEDLQRKRLGASCPYEACRGSLEKNYHDFVECRSCNTQFCRADGKHSEDVLIDVLGEPDMAFFRALAKKGEGKFHIDEALAQAIVDKGIARVKLQREEREILAERPFASGVFPNLEETLNAPNAHQISLYHVGRLKDFGRYLSVLDFVFCELFIEYRHRCFKYYRLEKDAKGLQDIVPKERVGQYEALLTRALEVAKTKNDGGIAVRWVRFRSEVLGLLKWK